MLEITKIEKKADQVLYILFLNKGEYLEIDDIRNALEKELIVPPKRIDSILQSGGDLITNKKILKKDTKYKIMQKGIDYIESLQGIITIIDPDSDSSERKGITKIFESLGGDVKICDPYVRNDTLEFLMDSFDFNKIKSITILTDFERRDELTRINKFKPKNKKNNIKVEFYIIKSLHDRWIVENDECYLLGGSINGIGKKTFFNFETTSSKKRF